MNVFTKALIAAIAAFTLFMITPAAIFGGTAIDRGAPAEDSRRILEAVEVLEDLNQNGIPDGSAAESLPDFAGDHDGCDAKSWQPGDPLFTELCRGMVPDTLIVADRSPAPSSLNPDGSGKHLYEMDQMYERQTE